MFLHRGSASQRISAARMRIAKISASHRIAISGFTPHCRSHRIAAPIARYGPLRSAPFGQGRPRIRKNLFSCAPSDGEKALGPGTSARFKVPEGHHPGGTTLREALRGNLPLRGLCGGLSEGSAGSLRGFCGVSAGFCGVRGIFRGFRG